MSVFQRRRVATERGSEDKFSYAGRTFIPAETPAQAGRHLNQGVKVTPTENNANTAVTSNVGLFAALSSLLSVKGSDASKTGRGVGAFSVRSAGRTLHPLSRLKCCVPALLCAMGGLLVFTAAPALAAAPETPANEKAASVTATTATLEGELNPGAIGAVEGGEYQFQYRASGTECEGESVAPEPAGFAAGLPGEPVSVSVTGLQPDQTYTFCLFERNATSEEAKGPPVTFTTLPTAPSPSGEVTSSVTATSAVLDAEIDPQGLTVTSCTFEYGTSTEYSHSAPCEHPDAAEIDTGHTPVTVSEQLEDLTANTTYHWRVIASNTVGTTPSADHTFVYKTTGEGLPDNRAYEMVTPPQKNGGLIGDVFGGIYPAISETGSRVIAPTIQCFAPSESCTGDRVSDGELFEFTRTPTGWAATALAPPATQFSENSAWTVSANEGTALFSMPNGPAREDEWYARSPNGAFLPIGPATPPKTTGIAPFGTTIRAATADLSHLVWDDEEAYWPFDKTLGEYSLYEYAGTHNTEPFLVGVSNKGLPKNSTEDELISACGTMLGSTIIGVSSRNALSADGRTVYFEARACSEGTGSNSGKEVPAEELYARVDGEEPDAHTVAISQPKALSPTAPDAGCATEECEKDIESPSGPAVNQNWLGAEFAGASADGSMAFFLDPQQLTDTATQATGSAAVGGCARGGVACNLYLYDFNRPEGHNLIDVSAPETGGESPRVQGVVATSADGSHVYFVAQGVLTATPNRQGQAARSGQDNLYVYERDSKYSEGHTAFVATLSNANVGFFGADSADWLNSYANVTPDGRFLVFESNADLTADDIRTPEEIRAVSARQVFRYDAESEQLVRVSIGDDGFDDNGNAGRGDASIVQAGDVLEEAGPSRGDPTMSNDGSYVFFQSPIGLTPHALDDVVIGFRGGLTEYAQNVYEYHEGHVYLISDGRDVSDARTPCVSRVSRETGVLAEGETFNSGVCLLGTDGTGANVFFMTADQLVPADTDTQVDIYDARVCAPAGGDPCIQPAGSALPPCGGEACHGIPAATPSLLAPGTASFNGAGNVAPASPVSKKATKKKAVKCRKGFVKNRRGKCVKKSKRKSKKAKKSTRRVK
jgi:hypothetical protein